MDVFLEADAVDPRNLRIPGFWKSSHIPITLSVPSPVRSPALDKPALKSSESHMHLCPFLSSLAGTQAPWDRHLVCLVEDGVSTAEKVGGIQQAPSGRFPMVPMRNEQNKGEHELVGAAVGTARSAEARAGLWGRAFLHIL